MRLKGGQPDLVSWCLHREKEQPGDFCSFKTICLNSEWALNSEAGGGAHHAEREKGRNEVCL